MLWATRRNVWTVLQRGPLRNLILLSIVKLRGSCVRMSSNLLPLNWSLKWRFICWLGHPIWIATILSSQGRYVRLPRKYGFSNKLEILGDLRSLNVLLSVAILLHICSICLVSTWTLHHFSQTIKTSYFHRLNLLELPIWAKLLPVLLLDSSWCSIILWIIGSTVTIVWKAFTWW